MATRNHNKLFSSTYMREYFKLKIKINDKLGTNKSI